MCLAVRLNLFETVRSPAHGLSVGHVSTDNNNEYPDRCRVTTCRHRAESRSILINFKVTSQLYL